MDCLGCRIANRLEPEVNVVFEDDFVVCVLDIAPFNEGHILILPKTHYHELEEMDRDSLLSVMDASVQMSKVIKSIYKPDGITVCQNGGIFNDLNHYHMHLIPRFQGDGFAWSSPVIQHNAETRLKQTRDRIVDVLRQASQEGSTSNNTHR